MAKLSQIFLGVDLGTGGARAIAVTGKGTVLGAGQVAVTSSLAEGVQHEQEPGHWWHAVVEALGSVCKNLDESGLMSLVRAIAVDGTSGTIVAVDEVGQAVRPALMYNDQRAEAEAGEVADAAGEFCQRMGYQIGASYAIAKIRWMQRHEPKLFERTARFCHQADFIVQKLTGEPTATDCSNALKTGYDLLDNRWPDWMEKFDGIRSRLPAVVLPGQTVGALSPSVADEFRLPRGLPVVSGATDGTAGFVASGVSSLGDYNTTLGTTLVFKALSNKLCSHPQGLIYSHKLSGGYWLPGAASNTGGEWIAQGFKDADLGKMDDIAEAMLPSEQLAYPLVRQGERFPFLCPDARGFCEPECEDEYDRYTANLQGTALIERLSYQVLDEATGQSGQAVHVTGGGARSDVWMQLRADVTGRVMHRPATPEAAFGAAILAATGSCYPNLWTAVQQMVQIEESFEPDETKADRYEQLYQAFIESLRSKGYLDT